MKILISFLLLLSTLLSMSACGAQQSPVQDSSEPSIEETENLAPEQEAGEDTATIEYGGVSFYPILLPEELQFTGEAAGILPGERSETVTAVKNQLAEAFSETELEFVSHSQTRPEVLDLFDTHLETLVQTIYLFAGITQPVCLDENTLSLLHVLPQFPEETLWDLYTVYKAELIANGIDGSLLRDGSSPGVYYMAQTDSDWAEYPFPNAAYEPEADDTVRNRACGLMSMTMVASTYLHRELDPTFLVDYVLENDWRVAISGIPDEFLPVAAELLGVPVPELRYLEPADGEQAIDWEEVRQTVENGGLVIVHVETGNFTSAQHYMVLTDLVEVDGVEYFQISDPYQLRSRYSEWDSGMADAGLGDEGLVLSTPELLAKSTTAVAIFSDNADTWTISCSSVEPFEVTADLLSSAQAE